MSEMKVRCVCCRKELGEADLVWQVRVVNCNGRTEYLPTCSEEHARMTQEKYSRIHAGMSQYIQQQAFQKMRVSDYLG